MTAAEITAKVIEIIADDYFLPEDIKLTDNLQYYFYEPLIDKIKAAMAFETEFGIFISDEAIQSWQTVEDVVNTVLKLTGNELV